MKFVRIVYSIFAAVVTAAVEQWPQSQAQLSQFEDGYCTQGCSVFWAASAAGILPRQLMIYPVAREQA